MIPVTLTVRGVKLDIQHDGDVIHCIEPYSDQEDILPIIDVCVIAELRALLFGRETAIVEPVYEVPMKTGGGTLAEVNFRRGYDEEAVS
jgi:hypothetical protein